MAVLIAGRIGSAMAAEIGSMRVYQEIDALIALSNSAVKPIGLKRIRQGATAIISPQQGSATWRDSSGSSVRLMRS